MDKDRQPCGMHGSQNGAGQIQPIVCCLIDCWLAEVEGDVSFHAFQRGRNMTRVSVSEKSHKIELD